MPGIPIPTTGRPWGGTRTAMRGSTNTPAGRSLGNTLGGATGFNFSGIGNNVSSISNALANSHAGAQAVAGPAGTLGNLAGRNLSGGARAGLTGAGLDPAALQNLRQLNQTGLLTDTSPLKAAALQEGQNAFAGFKDDILSTLAATGGLDSSASVNALLRAAEGVSSNIGIEGLRSDYAAQEAASGRRLGALNPAVGEANLRRQAFADLGGLESAFLGHNVNAARGQGDLQLGGAGLDQNARIAAGNMDLGLVNAFSTGLPGDLGGVSGTGGGLSVGGGLGRGPTTRGTRNSGFYIPEMGGYGGGYGSGINFQTGQRMYARGGTVRGAPDRKFNDFLRFMGGNMVRNMGGVGNLNPSEDILISTAMANLGGEDMARAIFETPGGANALANQGADWVRDRRFGIGVVTPRDPYSAAGVGLNPMGMLNAPTGYADGGQVEMSTDELLAQLEAQGFNTQGGAPAGPAPVPTGGPPNLQAVQAAVAHQINQGLLPAGTVVMPDGSVVVNRPLGTETLERFAVPGFAQGGTTDTVPAMLTPGEGIIPVDQMMDLMDADSRTEKADIATTLQHIMATRNGEPVQGYAGGGIVDRLRDLYYMYNRPQPQNPPGAYNVVDWEFSRDAEGNPSIQDPTPVFPQPAPPPLPAADANTAVAAPTSAVPATGPVATSPPPEPSRQRDVNRTSTEEENLQQLDLDGSQPDVFAELQRFISENRNDLNVAKAVRDNTAANLAQMNAFHPQRQAMMEKYILAEQEVTRLGGDRLDAEKLFIDATQVAMEEERLAAIEGERVRQQRVANQQSNRQLDLMERDVATREGQLKRMSDDPRRDALKTMLDPKATPEQKEQAMFIVTGGRGMQNLPPQQRALIQVYTSSLSNDEKLELLRSIGYTQAESSGWTGSGPINPGPYNPSLDDMLVQALMESFEEE